MNAIASFVSPVMVEKAMEWESGRVGSVAWLMIQEMAQGASLVDMSRGLNVDVEDLVALIEHTTGLEGEAATQVWTQALIAMRAAIAANQNQIQHGWDSIEALAVEKLGKSLAEMKTNGDPIKMLSIATAANKAIRRHQGEGSGQSVKVSVTQPVDGKGGDMSVELKSGTLGSMRLSLSAKIQAQLGDPSRVIDAVANKVDGGKLPLQLVGLRETRALADEAAKPSVVDSELDEKPSVFDLSFLDEANLDE